MSKEATERRYLILKYLAEQHEGVLFRDISAALQLERSKVRSDIDRMALKGLVQKKLFHGTALAGDRIHTTPYVSITITEKGLQELAKRKTIAT